MANRSKAVDRRRINTSEEHEIRYWTRALRISRERLFEAVEKAGNEVDDVRTYLATGSKPISTVAR